MQMYHNTVECCYNSIQYNMGQVTELRLSCYLVLLSIDSTKPGNKLAAVSWHDLYDIAFIAAVTEAEYKSKFGPTKYTPYLALTGEPWDVFVRILERIDRVITATHCIALKLFSLRKVSQIHATFLS